MKEPSDKYKTFGIREVVKTRGTRAVHNENLVRSITCPKCGRYGSITYDTERKPIVKHRRLHAETTYCEVAGLRPPTKNQK